MKHYLTMYPLRCNDIHEIAHFPAHLVSPCVTISLYEGFFFMFFSDKCDYAPPILSQVLIPKVIKLCYFSHLLQCKVFERREWDP